MDRDQALGGGHLGPVADAADMSGIAQRDRGKARLLAFLDADPDRLRRHRLAVAELAVDHRQRRRIDHDFGGLVRNLTGHDSHGVIRVPVYIRWKKMGSVVPDQTVELVVDTPSLAVVDGKFGYGQTVAPQAVRIGIEKCKAAGLAAVALRNAGHIGRVGDWAEMAAAEGLVSIHFVNAAGSLLVAPYGGVERRLSTAPYCVGIPRQGQDPIVLDFATSIVAEGKVLVASRGGKKLPKGALIDLDGNLSEDPAVLYGPYNAEGPRDHTKGTGAIRAFGEHKGSGLALHLRTARRRADRHRRDRGRTGASPTACSRSMSIPRWSIPPISSTAKFRAMSATSRTPSRPPASMPC